MRMARYNGWANQRVLTKLWENSSENESLGKLSHIALAESVWLSRLKGNHVKKNIFQVLSLPELESLILENNTDWLALLQNMDETDFTKAIDYFTIKGDPSQNSIADVLTHVFNHGTYHRAQIATILRQRGIDPIGTDFILFAREKESLD